MNGNALRIWDRWKKKETKSKIFIARSEVRVFQRVILCLVREGRWGESGNKNGLTVTLPKLNGRAFKGKDSN